MTAYEDVDPLGLYFRRYLHEDWMDEFASPESAFDELMTLPSTSGLQRLVEQLDGLLERDDEDLRSEIYRYTPYLVPRQDLGVSDREWVLFLRGRAAAELATRGGASDGSERL